LRELPDHYSCRSRSLLRPVVVTACRRQWFQACDHD
jgi:hypothetical protein